MVLLTSSTISVVISSSIVCMFTFFLFLSGYVMQQQTVRSLQEALHAPPVLKPTPTLPPQFQKSVAEDVVPLLAVGGVTPGNEDSEAALVDAGKMPHMVAVAGFTLGTETDSKTGVADSEKADVILNKEASDSLDGAPIQISEADSIFPADEAITSTTQPTADTAVMSQSASSATALQSPLRLAYVFTISTPSQICSAILFFKQHSQFYLTSSPSNINRPTYLLLYPSNWETTFSSIPAFTAALSLMRDAQDLVPDIIYHPVRTTLTWSGLASASTHSQLLGELQRWHWDFDRILYLRSPGLALNMATLDIALATSPMNLRRNWVSTASREGGANDDPPVMLLTSNDRRIVVPRGELRGRLTARAASDTAAEMRDVVQAAAYIYFDEDEVEQKMGDRDWLGNIFARYEKERMVVCKHINFNMEEQERKIEEQQMAGVKEMGRGS